MTERNFVVAGVLAMLMVLVVSSTPAAPTPKDVARYTSGPQYLGGFGRSIPEPAGSTTGIRRVAVTGFNSPQYPGWRASQIQLVEDSGSNGSLGVLICYAPPDNCQAPTGFQKGFCTNAAGKIDLRKIPFKPGLGLSIRIGVVQTSAVAANTPDCDGIATTGTIYVTYCKNKKGKKFC